MAGIGACESPVRIEDAKSNIVFILADDLGYMDQRNTFFWHYPFNVIIDNPDDGFSLTPHSAIQKDDYKQIYN